MKIGTEQGKGQKNGNSALSARQAVPEKTVQRKNSIQSHSHLSGTLTEDKIQEIITEIDQINTNYFSPLKLVRLDKNFVDQLIFKTK